MRARHLADLDWDGVENHIGYNDALVCVPRIGGHDDLPDDDGAIVMGPGRA